MTTIEADELLESRPKVGDLFTMAGVYERRSFWQWITRQPKRPKLFRVTFVSGNIYGYEL